MGSILTSRVDGRSVEDLRDRDGAHTGDDGSDGKEHVGDDDEDEDDDLDTDGEAAGDDDEVSGDKGKGGDKRLPERRRCSVTRTGMAWLHIFF